MTLLPDSMETMLFGLVSIVPSLCRGRYLAAHFSLS